MDLLTAGLVFAQSPAGGGPGAPPNVGGSYLELLLRMFFYLALVCALLWFGARWVLPRLYRQRFGPNRRIGMIDQIVLAAGKSVCVIKVVDRYYLVGVSDGGVRLMTELSRAEIEAAYPEAVGTRGATPLAVGGAAGFGEAERIAAERREGGPSPESKQQWGRKE